MRTKYETYLDRQVGKSETEIAESWGLPSQALDLPDGTKVYEYTNDRSISGAYGSVENPGVCKTDFYFKDNRVERWRWEGNFCPVPRGGLAP